MGLRRGSVAWGLGRLGSSTEWVSKKSFELGESNLREERQSWWVRALERRVGLAWVAGMDPRRGSEAWISGLGLGSTWEFDGVGQLVGR